MIEKSNEKEKPEQENMKNEEKDQIDIDLNGKEQEEILNKSDEIEKLNDDDQEL